MANQQTDNVKKGQDAELANVDVAGVLAVTGAITGDVTGDITGDITGDVTGTLIGGQQDTIATEITGDGAITIAPGTVFLSKGSAAAITIAAPTDVTHDGYIIRIISKTAQAHVITSATEGFNGKGSSGTLTFGGATGDSVILVAEGGDWWTAASNNVTPA